MQGRVSAGTNYIYMGGRDDFFKLFGYGEQKVCVRCGLKKRVKGYVLVRRQECLRPEERRKNAGDW